MYKDIIDKTHSLMSRR